MDAQNKTREALDRHWAATQAGDYEVEHEIYDENVVLDYPSPASAFRSGQRARLAERASRAAAVRDSPHLRKRRRMGD
jgi:hypothetical protein